LIDLDQLAATYIKRGGSPSLQPQNKNVADDNSNNDDDDGISCNNYFICIMK